MGNTQSRLVLWEVGYYGGLCMYTGFALGAGIALGFSITINYLNSGFNFWKFFNISLPFSFS